MCCVSIGASCRRSVFSSCPFCGLFYTPLGLVSWTEGRPKKPDLLRHHVPVEIRRVVDILLTALGPEVAFQIVLVVGTSFQHRLVHV